VCSTLRPREETSGPRFGCEDEDADPLLRYRSFAPTSEGSEGMEEGEVEAEKRRIDSYLPEEKLPSLDSRRPPHVSNGAIF